MGGHADDAILAAEIGHGWGDDPEYRDFMAYLNHHADLPWDLYPGPGRWSPAEPVVVPPPPDRARAARALAALD